LIKSKKRVLIVGGVAGGATAAAHARRLSEDSEIVIFERGRYVSFANCGLPYYIGGEIVEKSDLLVQTPEGLRSRFNLDVRVMSEVVEIDSDGKRILVLDRISENKYWEAYDDLILSIGSRPLVPPIPGIDLPGHFTVRGIPDVEAINEWISKKHVRNAVVVGGGFIGLEMVEQLCNRNFNVVVLEALNQVMAPLDPEMAAWLHQELKAKGVDVFLENPVNRFETPENEEQACASIIELKNGISLPADLVILGLGVRPETSLAQTAGIKIGEKGGVKVDSHLKTNKPNIWAIGDAIEVKDCVTKESTLMPLAGPANRQGRIVAENILGDPMKYQGTWGTSILRLFDLTAGCTGANEKSLRRLKIPHDSVYLHPASHASYYPDAHRIAMKVLFDPVTGKLLGAQAIGKDGVDKRIDVFATALKAGMTVHEMEDIELAYAPPFGSAKDPINLAGMVAQHVVHNDVKNVKWDEVSRLDFKQTVLLDVRDENERNQGYIPNSIHIPLPELRERYSELPIEKEIIVYCQTGQRSYFADRFLAQNGYRVKNLSGSYLTWKTAQTKL
jgi:NADPH-dependent 2,4-dienoyl-CoA reductase/sulfur reductase-like enzyme/rhodanese-related sulfurtransferase